MEPYDKITPITPSSQLDINTEFIISIQDRYYKLSKQAFLLVLCLSHGEDMDSAITSYQKKSGSSYSRKQISYVIENAINPIIYNNVIEPKKPLGFIFKRSIFSAQTVRTISKPLSVRPRPFLPRSRPHVADALFRARSRWPLYPRRAPAVPPVGFRYSRPSRARPRTRCRKHLRSSGSGPYNGCRLCYRRAFPRSPFRTGRGS